MRLDCKKCDNCQKKFWQRKECNKYALFFHDLCIDCLQTCSECGGEMGYLKNENFFSQKPCDFCDKEPCGSCGMTFFCEDCGVCYCEDCIEKEKSECVCNKIKKRMKKLRKIKS